MAGYVPPGAMRRDCSEKIAGKSVQTNVLVDGEDSRTKEELHRDKEGTAASWTERSSDGRSERGAQDGEKFAKIRNKDQPRTRMEGTLRRGEPRTLGPTIQGGN